MSERDWMDDEDWERIFEGLPPTNVEELIRFFLKLKDALKTQEPIDFSGKLLDEGISHGFRFTNVYDSCQQLYWLYLTGRLHNSDDDPLGLLNKVISRAYPDSSET